MRHRLHYLAMNSRSVNGVKSGDQTPEGYFEAAFATIARYQDLIGLLLEQVVMAAQ